MFAKSNRSRRSSSLQLPERLERREMFNFDFGGFSPIDNPSAYETANNIEDLGGAAALGLARPFPRDFSRVNASLIPAINQTVDIKGDFNGDGLDDVASYTELGAVWVATNDGNGGFQTDKWASGISPHVTWTHLSGQFVADAGGWDDLVHVSSDGSIWINESTGDGFVLDDRGHLGSSAWKDLFAGDVNGDGLDDLVHTRQADSYELWVNLADGVTGNFREATKWGKDGFSLSRDWTHLAGDFNGDSRMDVASIGDGDIYLNMSEGDHFRLNRMGVGATSDSVAWTDHWVGDFDGDGNDDLAHYHQPSGTIHKSTSIVHRLESTSNGSLTLRNGFTAADVQVEAEVAHPDYGSIGLVLRASGSQTENLYWGALVNYGSRQELHIWKQFQGQWQKLASMPSEYSLGVLSFEAIGSTLKLELSDHQNRQVLEFTDTFPLAAGSVGLRTTGTGGGYGDFAAENLVTGQSVNDHFRSTMTSWDVQYGSFATDSREPYLLTSRYGEISPHVAWTEHIIGDFTGDGKDDIAHHYRNGGEWWIHESLDRGVRLEQWQNNLSSSVGWSNFIAGDFVGNDQRDDLYFAWTNGGERWINQSTGQNFQTHKADTTITVGVIAVHGTQGDDSIELVESDSRIQVSADGGTQRIWDVDAVQGVLIEAFHGSDYVVNRTDLTSLIIAGSGSDKVEGGGAADIILGGGGDNYITAGRGHDIVVGGDGSDQIWGNEGRDLLFSLSGIDYLYGGADRDIMSGGSHSDYIFGGEGDDYISEYSSAHSGDDFMYGGPGNDTLVGGQGNDHLDGDAGNDRLFGHEGADTITGESGDDYFEGGGGADRIYGGDGADRGFGGDGDDTIYGETGNDIISGQLGNDYIAGGEGDDVLGGDEGDDEIHGGSGSDTLHGHHGSDQLIGGSESDSIFGDEGSDTLSGETGADFLDGGEGNDVLYGGAHNDRMFGGGGDDVIYGESGDDIFNGQAGNDYLAGGEGNDTIGGNDGNDEIHGGDHDDTLFGHDGDDLLYGDSGQDVLDGGHGCDTLNGTEGADEFVNGRSHCATANEESYYIGWAFLGHAEILLANGHTIKHVDVAWHLDELAKSITGYSFAAVAEYARDHVLSPHLRDLAKDINGTIDWESLVIKVYYLHPTGFDVGQTEDNWTPVPGDRSLPEGTRFF